MVKIPALHTHRSIFIIRLGLVLTLLASLVGFMVASASGEAWWPVGNGTDADIYAVAFDNSGSLYAGGSFANAGVGTANRIAKWDGNTWAPLGSGMSSDVFALATDGNGNLYAGGAFASAGGVTVNRVARWDGSAWAALGSGMNADVYALALSSSGDLVAGGDFATAGGATVDYIARWDGSTWSSLESGMNDTVRALAIDRNGNIYAGGIFTNAGSVTANHLAAWGNLQSGPIPTPTSLPPNSIAPTADNLVFCAGEASTVTINLTDVTNLFGYQFIMHYDPSLVAASAAFTNTFFDTRTNAIIPPEWKAICGSGKCKFAASLMDPAEPVSGSGSVAQIRLNGTSPGTFDLTISDDILTDRDSLPIQHVTHSLRLSVCNYASVSGTVTLQGHTAPIEAGQVTLTTWG